MEPRHHFGAGIDTEDIHEDVGVRSHHLFQPPFHDVGVPVYEIIGKPAVCQRAEDLLDALLLHRLDHGPDLGAVIPGPSRRR